MSPISTDYPGALPAQLPHPGLRISGLRGQIFLSLPGRPKPVTLSLADVEVLARCLADGAARVAPAALARLRALGALPASPPTAPAVTLGPLQFLVEGSTATGCLPPFLRTARHACLQPGPGGLVAWSATLGAYCELTQTAVRCLLTCADAQASPALLGAGALPAGTLNALVTAGLLVPATAAGNLAQVPQDAETMARLGGSDPYAGLVPDGRVPIYFVTHHVDHLPLALGMLRANLMAHDDGRLLTHFQPLPIVSQDVAGLQALFRRFGPGVWMFSNYMWSFNYNRQVSALVKAASADNLTVHGGPSAPKYEAACERFLRGNPSVDIVVRGEGEVTMVDLLSTLAGGMGRAALVGVAGITFRGDGGAIVRTPERLRLGRMDEVPSPYLTGMFDHYGDQVVAAILETNRGCPYACTFCDWGSATQQKIRSFDLERVKAEIDWIGAKGVRVLWIADANFGVFRRDIEIAEHIAVTKARHGYPREVVVNYPKNATEKIAEIVKVFARAGICGQGIISIQTTDPTTLAVIRRDNIKTSKYDELGEIFRREGLPLSTDLMIGLPGATVASFKSDLQYYFDRDVCVKAYRTQLLPNAPMADPEYMAAHRIRVDQSQHLVSTSSYTEADLAEMMAIWSAFDIADGCGLLRYVLRYMQWEHGISATEFLHAMVREVARDPARYAGIDWVLRFFQEGRQALGGWGPFYAEVAALAGREFGIGVDSAFQAVLHFNALMMPDDGRHFPERHSLAHDVAAWFNAQVQYGGAPVPPLREHGPGRVEISDPHGMCRVDRRQIEQYDNHQVFFELVSVTSRRRSVPNFVEKAA